MVKHLFYVTHVMNCNDL